MKPAVAVERRADGSILMRNPEPLADYPRVMTDRLKSVAAAAPDRVLLAERQGDGWRTMSYAEGWAGVQAIGQGLLDLGLGPDRPLAILSGGSLAHGLIALAATHVGVPYCPVSPAYSLLADTNERLSHVLHLLRPGAVFVEDQTVFCRALEQNAEAIPLVLSNGPRAAGIVAFDDLIAKDPRPQVAEAHGRIGCDDRRMILFTSGTTSAPKGVVTTHRMTAANQQMFYQTFPEMTDEPPVLLSWLPWHHTSGASCILGAVVHGGGSLWIDDGRPAGTAMERSIENLREITPTAYFSAPAGFAMLTDALRADTDLTATFFSRLKFFFYSGASLSAPVAQAMDEVALAATGRRVPFYSCYGMTETAPFSLAVNWPDAMGRLAGLPMPGATIKLVPDDGLLEVRVSGPHVMPAYLRNDAATQAAFDEEGFFRCGDAMAFVDPDRPEKGLVFDGRLGENFKLSTGTWVNVAGLSERILTAAGGHLTDAVIVGEGRDVVGALLFARTPEDPQIRPNVAALLTDMKVTATGSSTFVARALILTEPPNAAVGEVTDKGAVSQRTMIRTRAADIDRLYGGSGDVILPDPGACTKADPRRQH